MPDALADNEERRRLDNPLTRPRRPWTRGDIIRLVFLGPCAAIGVIRPVVALYEEARAATRASASEVIRKGLARPRICTCGSRRARQERSPISKEMKYEKPLLVDLTARGSVAVGLCSHGSRPGTLQQCASGGFADSPCSVGGSLQGCKAGIAAIGSCATGDGRY